MMLPDTKHRSFLPVLLVLAVMLPACGTSERVARIGSADVRGTSVAIGEGVEADSALSVLIAPFRERMDAHISEEIGRATALLERGNPEGALGNMAADAMLDVVQDLVADPVDCAVTNNGGLRAPIQAGPITVGEVYELMPFENRVTVVTLDAEGIQAMMDQIASSYGEPVAGCTLEIDPETRKALNMRVGERPIASGSTYRVVTSDYLANGGGNLQALWNPVGREDLPVLLRDMFQTYIREQGVIFPVLDGRIKVAEQ